MSAFACPIAGCTSIETTVIDTRRRPHNVWRKRQCSNGHRFSTAEAFDPVDHRFVNPQPLTPSLAQR